MGITCATPCQYGRHGTGETLHCGAGEFYSQLHLCVSSYCVVGGSQVVESLEETRTQLLLVTEPIFASAADLLARFATLPPAAADARRDVRLSELEIKAGLLQVTPALHLLSVCVVASFSQRAQISMLTMCFCQRNSYHHAQLSMSAASVETS